jgi:hypothetical protein
MFKTQQRQRAGWHWVLALVLLLMQQAGLRHGLQHATRDDGAPTHAACLECVAHHASDAGTLDATTPTLFTSPARHRFRQSDQQVRRACFLNSGSWPLRLLHPF